MQTGAARRLFVAIRPLESIDADHSIIRFNLDDIGWHPQDWDLVLANDPYAVVTDTQLTNVLEGAFAHAAAA